MAHVHIGARRPWLAGAHPAPTRYSDAKKYTLYIVDLHMTKLYEEVSQIMLISEASVLSRLGRLE